MEIEVLKERKGIFSPIVGDRTMELEKRFVEKIGREGTDTILKESSEILSYCSDPNKDEVQSVTNLAVGYVQSGKTMSFTMLSALAHDNNFRVIIYFAGTKTNLLSQTTERLNADLIYDNENNQYYKLFENPTRQQHAIKIYNAIKLSSKPTILITVLKHQKHITNLVTLFNSNQLKQALGKSGVIIIDDEADQASLNGYAYQNSKSEDWVDDEYTKIYKSIIELRSVLPNHSYIQYTATPQGPLLISMVDLLSPKHHTVLTPGKGYTGGETFFIKEPELIITIPKNEVYHPKLNDLKDIPASLVQALQLHLLGVALVVMFHRRVPFLSMLVHADKHKGANKKFYTWVSDLITLWGNTLTDSDELDHGYTTLRAAFKKQYEEATKLYKSHGEKFPTFYEIWSLIQDVILDTNIELIISSEKRQDKINWSGFRSHILVGADMLNRGFTVENLAITYMPRYSIGKSNADTIQQRCRFFGYKEKYLWSCRVFLPEESRIEYVEYVKHEEEMRQWLKDNKDLESSILLLSDKLNPTRKNILSNDIVRTKLIGWRQMNAFQAIEENDKYVNEFFQGIKLELLADYGTPDRNHAYAKLSIETVTKFLIGFKFQNMQDTARKQATIRYLNYLKSKKILDYAYIIQMAYRGQPRVRAFNAETLKVDNLHSGRSNSGVIKYPGDSAIKFDDSICIQIHKVKLKTDSLIWKGKEAYTLAIYYPEEFAINYVGQKK